MPVIDTTRGNAGKSAPKKKRYTPPPSRSDAAQRTGARSAPPPQRPKRDPNQGRSDAASAGRKQMEKADKFKRTSPKYRKAIEDAYDTLTSDEKFELLKTAKGVEGEILRELHSGRDRNAAQSGRHDSYSDRTRELVAAFKKTPSYKEALTASRKAREDRDKDALENIDFVNETDVDKLRAAGFKPEGFLDKAMKAPTGVIASGAAVLEATARDPIGVPVKTAKQGALAIPAALGGVVQLVRDPIGTVEEGAQAFVERSTKPYSERVADIRKQGAFEYGADVAVAVAPTSAAARGVARKAGAPVVPRAAERVSGGMVKPRRGTHGVVSGAVRTAAENRRAKKLERRLVEAEAGGKPLTPLEYQSAKANRKAGRVVELPTRREGKQFRNPVRTQVAKERARGVYGLRAEQARRVGDARKVIGRLSKKEQRALYYAASLGIRTADQARELLPSLMESIRRNRAETGIVPTGSLKKVDMLPELATILDDLDGHFTAKLADAVETVRPDLLRAGAGDPSLTPRQRVLRRHSDQAATLGIERLDSESDSTFIKRVRDAASDAELASPLYFKSERFVSDHDFGSHAVGGRSAMRADRRHEGRNLAVGLQDTRPEMLARGLARNIKRAKNWDLVAGMVRKHSIPELSPPGGASIAALRQRMAELGIDPATVAFWDAGAFDAAARAERLDGGPDFEAPEGLDAQQVSNALRDAAVYPDRTLRPEQLTATRKYVAVPTAMLRELEAETAPSGFAGRAWDVTKAKTSRAMLLLSPPWLAVNVASNALLTTAATKGAALNPAHAVNTARWWHGLDPAERERIGSYIGLDVTGADSHQVRLGATTNNDFINAYRAMKAHPIWSTGMVRGRGPAIRDLNPMELMARADRSQNNAARLMLTYKLMSKEAVKRAGREMGRADRAQLKIMSHFAKPPAEALHALARDRDLLEDHATSVADALGDFATLTAAERKVIGRTTMFYGWLRFSIKLVFFTLPRNAPATTAVLAELGALQVGELREILGDDGLPWGLGQIYFGDDGHVKSIDLAKINPSGNAVLDAIRSENPRALLGVAPPLVPMLFDQLDHSAGFRDGRGSAEWRVKSRAGQYGAAPSDYDAETRARIAVDDLLSLTFPYRTAKKLTDDGTPQGDDSLLWSKRPTVYKSDGPEAKLAKDRAAFSEREESLLAELLPFLPESSRDAEFARRQAALDDGDKAKPAKTVKYFGEDSKRSKPQYFGAR